MRVVVHVSHYASWEPVPADVKVTEQDIKAGIVRPNARDDGYLMRVERRHKTPDGKGADTHVAAFPPEDEIIAEIIQHAMPQRGGIIMSRRQALASYLGVAVLPHHSHPKRFLRIEVEDDHGPNEALFRAMLAPYVAAVHATGLPLIDPEDVETLVAAYMEPATADDHAKHLHEHFRVKPKKTGAAPAATEAK